jgi:hypothetical protein
MEKGPRLWPGECPNLAASKATKLCSEAKCRESPKAALKHLSFVAGVNDDCRDDPGNQQGEQAKRGPWILNEPYNQAEYNGNGSAVKDYPAPSLKTLLLFAGSLPQERFYL